MTLPINKKSIPTASGRQWGRANPARCRKSVFTSARVTFGVRFESGVMFVTANVS